LDPNTKVDCGVRDALQSQFDVLGLETVFSLPLDSSHDDQLGAVALALEKQRVVAVCSQFDRGGEFLQWFSVDEDYNGLGTDIESNHLGGRAAKKDRESGHDP
jgi:hypothetical protein